MDVIFGSFLILFIVFIIFYYPPHFHRIFLMCVSLFSFLFPLFSSVFSTFTILLFNLIIPCISFFLISILFLHILLLFFFLFFSALINRYLKKIVYVIFASFLILRSSVLCLMNLSFSILYCSCVFFFSLYTLLFSQNLPSSSSFSNHVLYIFVCFFFISFLFYVIRVYLPCAFYIVVSILSLFFIFISIFLIFLIKLSIFVVYYAMLVYCFHGGKRFYNPC